ncbi:MAG: hypothetical protein HGA97_01530 [Chlorobiaceae bacterium]|nr:hypothetical protein [Chlorobiaceae bacterium]
MKQSFEMRLLGWLRSFSHILHVFLAIVLMLASIMVLWEFIALVVHSVRINDLAHGFLQSLGTLFIVWTLSSLINAEINYVQTGVFHLLVIIEVAMISLLRQLIVEPVKIAAAASTTQNYEELFNPLHYGLLLLSLLVIGILHKIVATAEPKPKREPDQNASVKTESWPNS